MEIDKLKIEKEKIINLQSDYFDTLFNKINEYEKEIANYKIKLNNSENKINELIIELKLKEEEIISNKREISELRDELTKAEDEIYNLRAMNPYSKLELINDLKESYIKAADDESEDILDEILEEIDIFEEKISHEDMIFIMYMCYIYDRLQVLLSTSSMANNYYSNQSKESKLLKIVLNEENCKSYTSVENSTQSYIEKEKDLFKNFDVKLKERIIETLYDMSYRTFNGVYRDTNIEYGDNTIDIKAWVKEKNSSSFKLVSGIYSEKKDKMYISENMINILRLHEYEVLSENNIFVNSESDDLIASNIEKIKEMFLAEDDDELKKLMTSTGNHNKNGLFKEILKNDISVSTITLNEAYSLLAISVFYGVQNMLISDCKYLKSLYISERIESRFINLLDEEIRIVEGNKIELPVTIFLNYNKDKIKYIDDKVKTKIFKLVNSYFYEEFDNITITEERVDICKYNRNNLNINFGYLKIINISGDKKYYFLKGNCCSECNTIYISNDKYKEINQSLNGFKLLPANIEVINKEGLENNNINLKESKKYEELYNNLIEYFLSNNLGMSLVTFNSIVEDSNALKYYNKMQSVTLLFIGYLIKKSTFGASRIISNNDIGVSPDTILYKRLSEGRDFIEYLTEYRDSLTLIDPKVKGEIIVRIINIPKIGFEKYKTNTVINQEEFDGGNLNAESEIKKMGYSTSLTREERWNILKNKAVPKLGKAKVMGHISFLIKMNRNRSIMANAVNEWKYDLEKLAKL